MFARFSKRALRKALKGGGATGKASRRAFSGRPTATRRALQLASRRSFAGAAPLHPRVKLINGVQMPVLSLGTWKSKPGVVGRAVETAIRSGYRGIDAANDYNNEPEVGEAIKRCLDDGVCKREDLFIQCKAWNTNHRAKNCWADLEASLEDLGLDYLDSYVIHWPQAVPAIPNSELPGLRTGGPTPALAKDKPQGLFPVQDDGYYCTDKESHYMETWATMEEMSDKGLVRSIGISNFNRRQIQEVYDLGKIKPATLQNECHPYLQQKDLLDYCKLFGIQFQAFSPLGSGDTHMGVNPSPTGTIPLKDSVIAQVAAKTGKSPAQVILRWQLQRGISLVVKSVTPERIEQNAQLFDWELDAEDMENMGSINYSWRHLHWRDASDHMDYPFKDELPHDYILEKAPTILPN